MQDNAPGIVGCDAKCCVCLEENAEVIFETCHHMNTCKKCVIAMYVQNTKIWYLILSEQTNQ